jgi:hypothetical protein
MQHYTLEEKLELTERVRLTKLAKDLLRREKKKLAREGTKISMAKLACEAIIYKYS